MSHNIHHILPDDILDSIYGLNIHIDHFYNNNIQEMENTTIIKLNNIIKFLNIIHYNNKNIHFHIISFPLASIVYKWATDTQGSYYCPFISILKQINDTYIFTHNNNPHRVKWISYYHCKTFLEINFKQFISTQFSYNSQDNLIKDFIEFLETHKITQKITYVHCFNFLKYIINDHFYQIIDVLIYDIHLFLKYFKYYWPYNTIYTNDIIQRAKFIL